jgi:hypothetical protein
MGGLLAADAATDPSNNPDQHPGAKPRRIIGVVAFDTPYLGMHPHVVISGIASLLPKGNEPEKEGQSDHAMNDHNKVKIVDEKVTDDWEGYKKGLYCALLDSRFSCGRPILFISASSLQFEFFFQGFATTKHPYVNKLVFSSIVPRSRPHRSTKFTITFS